MSLSMKIVKRFERFSPKNLIVPALFTLALCTAVTLGIVTKQHSSAAVSRDCDTNSIDYKPNNGGCGAADPTELIKDVRQNDPSDLQNFYANFGLNSSNYDQFANTAKQGTVNRDGTVTVDGEVVMTSVDTYGRKSWGNPNRKPITISGVTYYHAAPSTSFASGVTSIPAMVMFDANGDAVVAVENPCGNGISGTKVHNAVTCNKLISTQPDAAKQPNTWHFSTDAGVIGNAKISRVVYTIVDGTTTQVINKTSTADGFDYTFKADGKVTVTVFANVPGGHEIQAAMVANCAKQIKYVPPFYACTNLLAVAIDDQKKSFRFTVITKTDSTGQTVLKDADFNLDGKNITNGVTAKDKDGNIYKEYTFTDDVMHTVKVSVNFNTAEGVKSATCQASVTPKKTPVCEVPGHEGKPIDSNCGYCQPGIPIGDTRCTPTPPTPPALTDTGPGDVIGLFSAATIAGFLGHKLLKNRASRRATSTQVA